MSHASAIGFDLDITQVKVSVMHNKILNYFHIVHCCHYKLINLIDDSKLINIETYKIILVIL